MLTRDDGTGDNLSSDSDSEEYEEEEGELIFEKLARTKTTISNIAKTIKDIIKLY
jgi:hypothetical protein